MTGSLQKQIDQIWVEITIPFSLKGDVYLDHIDTKKHEKNTWYIDLSISPPRNPGFFEL